MKKRFLLICALLGAFVLTACGDGGGGDGLQSASSDLTVTANASNGNALARAFEDEVFVFTNGVPAFGTTTTTTVVITDTTATPTFSITNGGNTATGELLFGSCIFVITASDFPPPSPLQVGAQIVVPNCQFTVRTRGLPATSSAFERSAFWVLGTAVSQNVSVSVTINPAGQVSVNDVFIGTVTLTPLTGG